MQPMGTTILVASIREVGHVFQDNRAPVTSSISSKVAMYRLFRVVKNVNDLGTRWLMHSRTNHQHLVSKTDSSRLW